MFKLKERYSSQDRSFTVGLGFQTPYEEDHDCPHNLFFVYLGRMAWWWQIPQIMKPKKEWVDLSNREWATPNPKTGKKGYFDEIRRAYSLKIGDGYIHYQYGLQRDSWPGDASGCISLPWTEVNQIRHEVFELQTDSDGKIYVNEQKRIDATFNSPYAKKPKQPSEFEKLNYNRYNIKDQEESFYYGKDTPYFTFFEYTDPYDGEKIMCRCFVEEREWHYGTSRRLPKFWKFIMSWKPHIITRRLDLAFQKETGSEKGSWKGGITGTSIDMLPNEDLKSAFNRYTLEQTTRRNRHGRQKNSDHADG